VYTLVYVDCELWVNYTVIDRRRTILSIIGKSLLSQTSESSFGLVNQLGRVYHGCLMWVVVLVLKQDVAICAILFGSSHYLC
jgi:hypothetical protein